MHWSNYLGGLERRLAGGDPPERRQLGVVGLWVFCVLATAAVVAFTGFPVIWEKLNDVLVLLDGGWRVWNGQVPHRDFYCVIGPYPLGVLALGFAIRHDDVGGFPLALLVVGILLSSLSWRASQGRLTPWWRLAVSLQILASPGGGNLSRWRRGSRWGSGASVWIRLSYQLCDAIQSTRVGGAFVPDAGHAFAAERCGNISADNR